MLNECLLVYFHSVVPGKYLAVWPVYIVRDDRKNVYCVQSEAVRRDMPVKNVTFLKHKILLCHCLSLQFMLIVVL